MKIYSLCILLILLLLSCETLDKKEVKKIAREVHYPDKESPRDSIFYYDENGYNYRIDYFNNNAFNRNEYNQGGSIDYVEVTDSLGNVYKDVKKYQPSEMLELREYRTIQNKLYLNQIKYLKLNKEIIFGIGNYFSLQPDKDTISLNNAVAVMSTLYGFRNGYKPSIKIIKPLDNSINFNADFSNIDEVDTTITYNLNIELNYRKQLGISNEEDLKSKIVFGRYFEEVGDQNFRGILVEYYDEEVAPDSVVHREHKYYFDIPVFVKDTVE